uniref:Uncharacterized protein n=3 Tax=Rhizobium/Agrobacterium group TaxID=227290 RepID=A0A2Z2PTC7_AGRTU|nr:hypothetical protein [Rhizobium rhizogenes]ASK45594.1 hypothetical protein [Agrobacterium radiobacter]ASK45736.1 hypothetical protein [Agrobacterium tumefaciens]ASK45943.1 hypothetical protein [Agrobacterium radiobacter]ASK46186.1 hypothetical protein [Agrobacterium rubi]
MTKVPNRSHHTPGARDVPSPNNFVAFGKAIPSTAIAIIASLSGHDTGLNPISLTTCGEPDDQMVS